ncbi:MAG: lamin tail domain-containing protein, partial [Myxococcota bacterium]|nr:lamin tail domain-containing protein [Myxococcota bacterium]
MVLDARKRKGSVGPRGPGLRGVVRAFSAMIIVVLLVLAAYFAIRLAEMSTLAVAEGDTQVSLNELMASNRYTLADEDFEFSDWIEVRNEGDFPVNLQGFGLSDDIREPFKWRFPWLILRPGEHRTVFASNKDRRIPSGELHTNFRLRTRETLILTAAGGQLIDSVDIDEMPSDVSMGRSADEPESWIYFAEATPGDANLTPGWTRAMDIVQVEDAPVYVAEYMAVNRASVVDEDGDFSDWIEFHNGSDEPVDMGGFYLSDEMRMREKWRFPERILAPGERLLVYASGKDRRTEDSLYLHTNFRVSAGSEVVLFCDASRRIIDLVETEVVPASVSMGRREWGGGWQYFPRPTPGEANDTHGLDELPTGEAGVERPPGVRINEVQSSNRSTHKDASGDTPDWIELHNPTPVAVSVEGYFLSDDEADLFRWRLPAATIAPGGHLLLHAGGPGGDGTVDAGGVPLAPFKLNPGGEELFLVDSWGTLADTFATGRLRSDMSSGRLPGSGDRVFFRTPTPGGANDADVYSGYSPDPRFDPPGGFHEGVVHLELAVDDPATEIRYAIGGAAPGPRSKLYTEPIEVKHGTVVRAAAYGEGRLPSSVVTHTYLIDAQHSVPVIALTTTPEWLFDETHGLYMDGPNADEVWPHRGANYYSRRELPAHVELIETDGRSGLGLDAGIRIYGAFSRIYAQKSFMVTTRDRYGIEEINYPLFADKDVLGVKKMVLSTGGSDS